MLVKELVEILSEYEQDAEVFLALTLPNKVSQSQGVELSVDSPEYGVSPIMELFLNVAIDTERHKQKDAAAAELTEWLESGDR